MYTESLKAEARRNAASSELQKIMVLISSLGVESRDIADLREDRIFPVRHATGFRIFSAASPTGEFMIVDRKEHLDAFRNKISTLDFSLEDIRDTRPFLLASELQGQFSSELVEEVTSVNGGKLSLRLTDTMRNKAHAIVRYVFIRHKSIFAEIIAALHIFLQLTSGKMPLCCIGSSVACLYTGAAASRSFSKSNKRRDPLKEHMSQRIFTLKRTRLP
jgi:hypothetical protein